MGAKTSTEARPRTYSNSEGGSSSSTTSMIASSTTQPSLVRGNSSSGNPFATNADTSARLHTHHHPHHRGRSYSSSSATILQSHQASGILELSGRINSFAASGFWPVAGIRCPICNKTLLPDDIEVHLVMCLTRPRINYNEDVLIESMKEDDAECVICLEEMEAGQTIARLPCLCVYHKQCIDKWFTVNRSCPEHPNN